MWELDHKESWVLKNWCLWTVVLEKTLESPLDCKEIKPVYPKGNQSWIFLGRTDAEAETLMLWPPDAKNWLTGKDPDARKDWRQEERGTTEDEMVGWHHQLDGHEFEQSPGVADGQGSLECCSPWGRKESDMTEWTELTQGNLRIQYNICQVTSGMLCFILKYLSVFLLHLDLLSHMNKFFCIIWGRNLRFIFFHMHRPLKMN